MEGPEDAGDAAHAGGQVVHFVLGDAPRAGGAEAGYTQPRQGRQEAPAPPERLEVHLVGRHRQQLVALHQLVVDAHKHLHTNRDLMRSLDAPSALVWSPHTLAPPPGMMLIPKAYTASSAICAIRSSSPDHVTSAPASYHQ